MNDSSYFLAHLQVCLITLITSVTTNMSSCVSKPATTWGDGTSGGTRYWPNMLISSYYKCDGAWGLQVASI